MSQHAFDINAQIWIKTLKTLQFLGVPCVQVCLLMPCWSELVVCICLPNFTRILCQLFLQFISWSSSQHACSLLLVY